MHGKWEQYAAGRRRWQGWEDSKALEYALKKQKQLTQLLKDYEKEYYDLNKTYTRGVLDDEFYLAEKQTLQNKIAITKNQIAQTEMSDDQPTAQDAFRFATHAKEAFTKGDTKIRREIFSALGSNFILKDRLLTFQREAWLRRISDIYPKVSKKLAPFIRTDKTKNLHRKNGGILRLYNFWLGRRDSNPRMPGPKPGALPLGHSPLFCLHDYTRVWAIFQLLCAAAAGGDVLAAFIAALVVFAPGGGVPGGGFKDGPGANISSDCTQNTGNDIEHVMFA